MSLFLLIFISAVAHFGDVDDLSVINFNSVFSLGAFLPLNHYFYFTLCYNLPSPKIYFWFYSGLL